MKNIISALGISAIILFAGIAEAGVIKTSENGRNVIYVTSQTVGTSVQLQQTGGTTLTSRLADACGMIRLTKPSAGWSGNPTVNGTTVDRTTLSAITPPTCTGGTLTPAQTANFKDASDNIYLVGLTANTAATIGLPSTGSRTARVNGCGFARFAESTSSPWTSSSTMNIAGTAYTFSAITAQTYPPYCRNTGTSGTPNYVLYQPASTTP